MKAAGVIATLILLAKAIAGTGPLEVKRLGEPFRARELCATPAAPRYIAPLVGLSPAHEGPTIDAVTGLIIADAGGSRSNTTVYDNSATTTDCFAIGDATTQIGDILRMTNGGTLRRLKLSLLNADETNRLTAARIKVVFYDGATPVPNLLASFTTGTIDFSQITWPDWPPYCVFLTLDTTGINPPVVLPQLVYVGYVLEEIVGTPAAPTRVGQAVYGPPAIGTSRDTFWDYTLDGAGLFTPNWYFGGYPRANFYYELEVAPVAQFPPPIYDNTQHTLDYAASYPVEAFAADDLVTLPPPPGEFLDRVDFSIFNGSTSSTLNYVDFDIVLCDWNPIGSEYYAEGAPGHAVTIPLNAVPVDLPPGYVGLFYVAGLAPQGWTVSTDVLAGLRFRRVEPATVERVGQAVYFPPVVGASEDVYWRAGWSGYIDAWYWFGGDPHAAFYWKLSTSTAQPCGARGDMNCDGSVNSQDIDGFIYALFNLAAQYSAYLHSFPVYRPCEMTCGDFTGDGSVNAQDIDGFIAALF